MTKYVTMNQEELRDRFREYFQANPVAFLALGKKIKVSPITLRAFYDGKTVGIKISLMIKNFLNSN